MQPSILPLIQTIWSTGLTENILEEVIVRGEVARDSATSLDPPSRAGFDAWAERVRALRELLLPVGWEKSDDSNLSTVVSPCGRHAISVVSGDCFTGLPKHTPQPKHPRGDATSYAVEQSQLSLFPSRGDGSDSAPLMWFLLVVREGTEVRAELSLPASITDEGFVSTWRVRHILPPLKLGAVPVVTRGDQEPAVVEVQRKG